MATKKDQIGNIIKIKVDANTFGFGRIIEGEFIEFYNLKLNIHELGNISDRIIHSKVIFTLSVHKSWKKNENWEIVGNNPDNISKIPRQFMQDIVNLNDIKIIDAIGWVKSAKMDEIKGIERLAVWEDNHVEDRLRDYFNNKPNIWVEQLKPKIPSK